MEIKDPQNFFDVMSDILLKKSGGTLTESMTFKKSMSPYMLCRYLSMRDDLILYAALLQKYLGVLTDEQIYKWAYDHVPKQKSGFIKYITKPKKEKKKKNEMIED